MNPPRVGFAVVAGDMVHNDFACALTVSFLHAAQNGLDPKIIQARSTILPYSRSLAAIGAQSLKCTHLLFIDSDMRFPNDVAARLLQHLKDDVWVAVASYRQRAGDHLFTHRELDGSTPNVGLGDFGCREVARAGTGCMLIDMRIFDLMERPFFRFVSVPGEDRPMGEDMQFCDVVRSKGKRIVLDCALSHEVAHIGQMAFTTTSFQPPPTLGYNLSFLHPGL